MTVSTEPIMRRKIGENSSGIPILKLSAIPLITILLISGMPLGRDLAPLEFRYSEQLADAAIQKAGQIGLENTWTVAITLGLIYAFAFIIFLRNKVVYKISNNQCWQLTALALSSCLSILWSSFPLAVLMNFAHLIGVIFVAVVAGRAYSGDSASLLRYIAYTLCLNVTVHTLAAFVMPDVAISHDGRWSGLTTNPNSLGLISALALWSTASAIRSRVLKPIAGIALTFPALISLYGSGSATSSVSAMIGIVFVALLPHFKKLHLGSLVIMAALPTTGIALSLWFNLYFNYIYSILGKSSDFSGRTSLWQQGIEVASKKPILGWGYDNHASVMIENVLPFGHFHNGFIDLAVRGGLVGVLLMIGLIFAYLVRSMSQSLFSRNIMISYMAMFLVYNMTEVSLLSPKNPSWIIFITLIFSARKNSERRKFDLTLGPIIGGHFDRGMLR